MFHVFESISTKLLSAFLSWVFIPGVLMTWVAPLILAGLTIQIMMQGYGIMRGQGGQDHLLDVFFKSLRAFLVVTLCLTGAAYFDNIMGLANDLKDGLLNLFAPSGGASKSAYAKLDSSVNEAITAFKKIWILGEEKIDISISNINLIGLSYIASGIVLLFCFGCYAIVAAVNLLIIDFSLHFIFAVGPLFVACYAFQATSGFFNTWVVAVLKYIFTAIVIVAIIGLGTDILGNYAAQLKGVNDTTDYISLAVGAFGATGILIFLSMRAASLAADMVGGAAMNLVSATPLAKNITNKVGSTVSHTTQGAARAGAYGVGRASGALANTQVGQRFAHATSGARQTAASVGTVMRVMQGKTGAAYSTPERRAAMNRRAGNVRGAYSSGYNDSNRSGIGTVTRG